MNTVRNEPQVLHSLTPATKDLSPGTPVVQEANSLAILFICRSDKGREQGDGGGMLNTDAIVLILRAIAFEISFWKDSLF
jgi:hypothetical protein